MRKTNSNNKRWKTHKVKKTTDKNTIPEYEPYRKIDQRPKKKKKKSVWDSLM